MSDLASIMALLKEKGTERGCKIYVNHGMPAERVYGVSIADLKVTLKSIRGDHALALELFATRVVDAMYLAAMATHGSKMTVAELNDWASIAADAPMISEYSVPWVAVEHPNARELAMVWIDAEEPGVQATGWCTYVGIAATVPDDQLDLREIETLLDRIVRDLPGAANRVRYAMNSFVISVGYCVLPLHEKALATAEAIDRVKVEMGKTACKVPLAASEIKKAESMGRVGRKRKTMRC